MSQHSRQPSVTSLVSTSLNNHTSSLNKIGPWKLGRTLGAGSAARVVLAENQEDGQKAAVKIVSKSILNSSHASQSADDANRGRDAAGLAYGIEREIIIMKLLNHPNVLRLYDVWETSKNLYLILEYVEGGELFDLLVEEGPLEESEAIRYFRQIIMGISYCHALGICHRDLKPENLLLDHDLNIKIADFGMAALENNDRLLETSCGSPHYAAPEIVSGLPYHGFESDVWSCGVILFALLTGRLPFDDENIRNLLLKVQSGSFEMPGLDEITPEAQDLIGKMLTVDPSSRITTQAVLSHPLLQKYQISPLDAQTLHNLPSPNSYLNKIRSAEEIDEQILQNLITLWHGVSKEEIIANLLKPESTTERIFYFLLLRYRHNQSQSSLVRSISIARSLRQGPPSAPSRPSPKTPKKSKRLSISASSSAKKSVSFNSQKRRSATYEGSPLKNQQHLNMSPEVGQPPAIPQDLLSELEQMTKKQEQQQQQIQLEQEQDQYQQQQQQQPPPAQVQEQHQPQQPQQPAVQQLSHNLTIQQSPKKSHRLSRSMSKRRSARFSMLGGGKRGSITTKLIAVYAKMAEDNDWVNVEKETKRTSTDFATLCDEIFDHEKFEKIRLEKEAKERAERERKEQERRERERRERQEREAKELEQRRIRDEKRIERLRREEAERQLMIERERQQQLEQDDAEEEEEQLQSSGPIVVKIEDDEDDLEEVDDFDFVAQDDKLHSSKIRSVSAQGQTSASADESKLLNPEEITRMQQRRSITNPYQARPKSRLDPGLNFSQEDWKSGKVIYEENDNITKAIRRSKFLGSRFELNVKKQATYEQRQQNRISISSYGLGEVAVQRPEYAPSEPKAYQTTGLNDEYDGPKTIAEVKIPKVTRKSRHFSQSNKRLSVLSIYSTKNSYADLHSKLMDLDSNDDPDAVDSSVAAKRQSIINEKRKSILKDANKRSSVLNDIEETAVQRPQDRRKSRYVPETLVVEEEQQHQQQEQQEPANANAPGLRLSYADRLTALRSSQDELDHYDSAPGAGAEKPINTTSMADAALVAKPTPLDKNSPLKGKERSELQINTQAANAQAAASATVGTGLNLPTLPDNFPAPNGVQATKRKSPTSAQSPLPQQPTSAASSSFPAVTKNESQPLPKAQPNAGRVEMMAVEDTTPSGEFRKRSNSNGSFFRKFSGASDLNNEDNGKPQRANSGGSSFFRIFSSGKSKSKSKDQTLEDLQTVYSRKEIFEILKRLLNSWKDYGLKNLNYNDSRNIITGEISKHNFMNYSTTHFQIRVMDRGDNGKYSSVGFDKIKGSNKALKTLYHEIMKIFARENVLAFKH
ncbi:hypothetical protein WICPIJ_000511 [Wickerhamomyces pijperi]|uniref:non-specific serine/threonine protein kinase n=1 Tax=Wickerhamomyces pijperi TaxID=599730 RepID=A0A9P8TSH4_WICPI|nr:hypothetical protein WICPIJ_000511 [Wickerhamomyces pijperi]